MKTGFTPYVPEDFEAFWSEVAHESKQTPLNFRRRRAPELDTPTHQVDWIGFMGALSQPIEGWIAYPHGARRTPAFLWIPPYGRESLLPNEYGTREGMTSMSLNLHGLPAFHQETYVPARGYFAEGAGSPQTWIFRRLVQHCLIAARVLQAQLEADEDHIGAAGMSQGGGLALWTGAFSPIVGRVVADMPFLGCMPWVLSRPVHRYPLKELEDFMESEPIGRERVHHTLSYFDTMNVATRCEKPTLVTLGLRDPAVKPESARAIHEALPGPKALIEYPGGHDWDTAMVRNNRDWLLGG